MNPNLLAQFLNGSSQNRIPPGIPSGPYPQIQQASPQQQQSVGVCNMCLQYHGALEGITTDINFLKETILMLQNKWSGILYNSVLLQQQHIGSVMQQQQHHQQQQQQQQQLLRAVSMTKSGHVGPSVHPSGKLGQLQPKGNINGPKVEMMSPFNAEATTDSTKKNEEQNNFKDELEEHEQARNRMLTCIQNSGNLATEGKQFSPGDLEMLKALISHPTNSPPTEDSVGPLIPVAATADAAVKKSRNESMEGEPQITKSDSIREMEIPETNSPEVVNFKGISWFVKSKSWGIFYVEKGQIQQEHFIPQPNEKQENVLKRALDFRRAKCQEALEKERIRVLPVTPTEEEVKQYFVSLNKAER